MNVATGSGSGSDTSVTTGQKHWDTPIAQLPNQIDPSKFDGYVLFAKKGDNIQLFTNYSEDSQEKSQLFEKVDETLQSEM